MALPAGRAREDRTHLYAMEDEELQTRGREDLMLVRDLFRPLTCPVLFLFGNHDHPALYSEVFSDQPDEIDVGGHRVLLFHDREVDCHRPQRMGLQRSRFLEALGPGDDRPQIHLQHYLIAPKKDGGYPHSYLEAGSLREAVETVAAVNDKMACLLEGLGVTLDGVYCRHESPTAVIPKYRSETPKTEPSPAMLLEAAEHLNLSLDRSFMVGDRATDLEAGRNAGCRAVVLVRTGDGETTLRGLPPGKADGVVSDLPGAVQWILDRT